MPWCINLRSRPVPAHSPLVSDKSINVVRIIYSTLRCLICHSIALLGVAPICADNGHSWPNDNKGYGHDDYHKYHQLLSAWSTFLVSCGVGSQSRSYALRRRPMGVSAALPAMEPNNRLSAVWPLVPATVKVCRVTGIQSRTFAETRADPLMDGLLCEITYAAGDSDSVTRTLHNNHHIRPNHSL